MIDQKAITIYFTYCLLMGALIKGQAQESLLAINKSLSNQVLVEVGQRVNNVHAELSKTGLRINSFSPRKTTQIPNTSDITLVFNQRLKKPVVHLPAVYVNKATPTNTYEWSVAQSKLTLRPTTPWPGGSLVTIEIDPLIESKSGELYEGASEYEFIVDTAGAFGVETIDNMIIATVDHNGTSHNIRMSLTLPANRTKPVPVHFWVHGGGWQGGTAEDTWGKSGPHAAYLAEELGIATLGLGYRCIGSKGTFTLAMQDIDAAFQWAVKHATAYNFDMANSFFSGGSAGTPLAALAAQRYDVIKAFVGLNGVYNFAENPGSRFAGNTNGGKYAYCTPSCEENSPIYNLRANPPITMLMHGDNDATINYQQSVLFADRINRVGGKAAAIIYPGEPHAFFNKNRTQYEDVLYEMATFLKSNGIFQGNTAEGKR